MIKMETSLQHLLTTLFQNLQKLFKRNWSRTFGHINHFKLDRILYVKRYSLVFVLLSRMQQRIVWNRHLFCFFRSDIEARFRQRYKIVTLVYNELFKCFKTCNFMLKTKYNIVNVS